MDEPLQIVVRGISLPAAVEAAIRARVRTLERACPRLIGCSVRVDGPGIRHRGDGPYAIRLELRVPGARPIVVDRPSRQRLERAVDHAFDVAAQWLEDLQRLQRCDLEPQDQPAGQKIEV